MHLDRYRTGIGSLFVAALVVVLAVGAGAARSGAFPGSNGLIAYTCGSNVCTANPDGSAAKSPLIPGASDPSWSADGRIAYVASDGIDVASADGTAGHPIGTPTTATQPTWSPFGGEIAYVNGGDIYTISSFGGGTPTPLKAAPPPITEQSPAWSPDGQEIAYSTNQNGNFDIYVLEVNRPQTTTPIATGTANDVSPSWSPDGLQIVYSSGSPGELFTVPSDGSGPATDLNVAGTNPVWSPDGATIAYHTASGLSLVRANGADPHLVQAGATNDDPDWQPVSTTGGGGGNFTGPPVNTAYPGITLPFGETQPEVGDFLFADTGTWDGAFPMTFEYQWKKCSSPTGSCFDLPGQTSSFFTPTFDVFGWSLRVQVTATNDEGKASQNSEATQLVTALPAIVTSTPEILGQNMVGQTLTLTPGVWAGGQPMTFKYDWRFCNPAGDLDSCVSIPDTDTSYTPTTADIGKTIRVYITGTNPAGSSTAITNHTFPIVDVPHFAPSTSSPPSVTGKAQVGSQLTADLGSWGGDLPITTKLVWQRCDATGQACKTIPKATKTTYKLVTADLASTVRVQVSAVNAYGNGVAQSDTTDTVRSAPPHVKGRRFTGTAKADYISGTGRDDTITGGKGNDTLLGGAGYDSIDGGPGNDIINGGTEADKLNGGPGSDTIQADDGDPDVIDCGPGNDRAVVDDQDKVKNCEVVQTSSSGSGGTSNPPPGGTVPTPPSPPFPQPPSPPTPGGGNGNNND
ncbi:MAG TPA: hypothetical protein VGF23_23840 [Gaiellaceae bacterium]